jgi:hypothetical protein
MLGPNVTFGIARLSLALVMSEIHWTIHYFSVLSANMMKDFGFEKVLQSIRSLIAGDIRLCRIGSSATPFSGCF